MTEQSLFQMEAGKPGFEIVLGEYPCDIPFGGGAVEKVVVSLTTNSPRSQHGIPVLRLDAGHHMEFAASEQTPAGHAAKLVADWLNETNPEEGTRHFVELFLWQWPGIREDENGNWQLANLEQRKAAFSGKLLNCKGEVVAEEAESSELPIEQILDCNNLQVHPIGFCSKGEPCFLLDACLTCPLFLTTGHFAQPLQNRASELQNRRNDAVAGNNHRLAEACHNALRNIEMIMARLGFRKEEE